MVDALLNADWQKFVYDVWIGTFSTEFCRLCGPMGGRPENMSEIQRAEIGRRAAALADEAVEQADRVRAMKQRKPGPT